MDSCAVCGEAFERRSKGYKRYGTHELCHNETILSYIRRKGFLYGGTSSQKFVCADCYSAVKSSMTLFIGHKRKQVFSPVKTPILKKPCFDRGTQMTPQRNCNKLRRTWKGRACQMLRKNNLHALLKLMYSTSVGKKAILKFAKTITRNEAREYCSGERALSQHATLHDIEYFQWYDILDEVHDLMPCTYQVLSGVISQRKREEQCLNLGRNGRMGSSVPGLGVILAMLIHKRHPQKFAFLQEIMSLELFASGCKQKVLQCFQHIGLCKGIKGTLNVVDRIKEGFAAEIISWKANIEEEERNKTDNLIEEIMNLEISNAEETPIIDEDTEDVELQTEIPTHCNEVYEVNNSDDVVNTISDDDGDDESDDEGTSNTSIHVTPSTVLYSIEDRASISSESTNYDEFHPGFASVWDNVQMMSVARHQSETKQNTMHLWALAFAVENRVSFRHLVDVDISTARQLPMHTFLPNALDFSLMRNRMEIIVMRILKRNFTAFSMLPVNENIPHQYHDESGFKSKLVNLGVYEENPSTLEGVVNIMDTLHKYVPVVNDKLFVIPCHGDGLSVERMRDAKSARAGSDTPDGRLEGLEPMPQEFHKRCIILQDLMDDLYTPASGNNSGTLFQIRNRFNLRNVTKCVNTSFNAITDFLSFVSEGLVCLLALQLQNYTSLDDIPDDFPDTVEGQSTYITRLADKIVSTIWNETPDTEIDAVLDADESEEEIADYYEYCLCNEEKDERMVRCSNRLCNQGLWFHLSCKELDEIPIGEWWCCQNCAETGGLGMESKYKGFVSKDHVYQYTCEMAFRCLSDLVERDCQRENDGEGMVANWRIAMPQFWSKGHNKYLIIGHKLLADIGGCLPARLRNEAIWNRTVNLQGGKGHNLPMDLVNEFLNRDFKENLKTVKGQYTSTTVERISQYSGALGQSVSKIFQHEISGTHCNKSRNTRKDMKDEIVKFVDEYKDDHLFDIIPGREHSAFPGYSRDYFIENPLKLKKRLKKYSYVLDRYRLILP